MGRGSESRRVRERVSTCACALDDRAAAVITNTVRNERLIAVQCLPLAGISARCAGGRDFDLHHCVTYSAMAALSAGSATTAARMVACPGERARTNPVTESTTATVLSLDRHRSSAGGPAGQGV